MENPKFKVGQTVTVTLPGGATTFFAEIKGIENGEQRLKRVSTWFYAIGSTEGISDWIEEKHCKAVI